MTTIISIPNQVQHIQQAHTAILKSFTDNFIVFGSLGEFEDQNVEVKYQQKIKILTLPEKGYN